jgi:hypothetical protein
MPRYRITTLVDITRTDAKKSDPNNIRINQQQNFNTLRQSIELRSNVTWHRDPQKHKGALPEPFEGKASYWTWSFETEREDLFLKDGDPVALLREDVNNVPVISGLEETVDITPCAFITIGEHFNTVVEII